MTYRLDFTKQALDDIDFIRNQVIKLYSKSYLSYLKN